MGHFLEGWTLGDAPLSSAWGRTPQKNFLAAVGGLDQAGIPLSQRAEGRNGSGVVTNSHILLGSKPFDSASTAVRVPAGPVVKNMPANVGDSGDASSVPGSEDPLKEEMATHCSILAWAVSRTEEPGGLQAWGSQKACMTAPHLWLHLLSLNPLTSSLLSPLTFSEPQLFYVH